MIAKESHERNVISLRLYKLQLAYEKIIEERKV
jgi:hypothetical protein